MTVWVVTYTHPHEYTELLGVFSSRQLALETLTTDVESSGRRSSNYIVSEIEVDTVVALSFD